MQKLPACKEKSMIISMRLDAIQKHSIIGVLPDLSQWREVYAWLVFS